jgi:chemotaxis protein MotB
VVERSERLHAQGFGESRPLEPGTSPAARAKNRRVELVIESPPADILPAAH